MDQPTPKRLLNEVSQPPVIPNEVRKRAKQLSILLTSEIPIVLNDTAETEFEDSEKDNFRDCGDNYCRAQLAED